jgi:RHS repeat-associated protein
VRRFGYDPRYRLITATGREHDLGPASPPWADSPGGTDVTRTRTYAQGYDSDPAGNLLRLTHQAGTGAPTRTFGLQPGTNRLAALTVGGVEFRYAYDAAGNLVAEGDSRHLEWDVAGRLRTFRVQAGPAEPSIHAQYLYDAAGQRVRKVVRRQGGQIDSTTYVGAFEHHRHLGGAPRESNTVHVMDDRQRLALVRVGPPAPGDATPAVTYQLGDHLSSAALVLDDAGGEVSREEFTPYGETSFGGHAFKRYRFTGKERDEESGLSYHGARYYAPWLARWTAMDPAGPVDGTNLYQYARSNPMVLADPSGTQAVSESSGAPSAPAEQLRGTGSAQAAEGLVQAGLDIARGVTGLVDPDTYEGMAAEMGRRYDEAGGGPLGVIHAGNMFNPFAQAFEAGVKMGEAIGEGDLRGFTRYSIHAGLSFVAAKALVRTPAAVARGGAAAAAEADSTAVSTQTSTTSVGTRTSPDKGGMSIQITPHPDLTNRADLINALKRGIERRMRQLGIPEERIGIRGNHEYDDVLRRYTERPETAFDISMETEAGSNYVNGADVGGVNVGAGVFGRTTNWPEFNAASWRTRIDSVIAHEWLEFQLRNLEPRARHAEAVRLGHNYMVLSDHFRLPISARAADLLKTMPLPGPRF